jgi:Fe-S oxidoreductase/nitrate reductase gamma subunit
MMQFQCHRLDCRSLPVSLFANAKELTREILGNIPPSSRIIFYTLSFVALLAFSWGIYRRARLWRLGSRVPGRFELRTVIAHFTRNVLLQQRVLGRGRISLAHVLLFSGFMILFIGTVLLFIEHGLATLLGRAPTEPLFHKGIYYAAYEFVMDTFGLLLLAGCVLFVIRRTQRPKTLGHNWLDWYVLSTLVVLGVTGYFVEGLRIIRDEPPWPGLSFVGWLCARVFQAGGVTVESAATIHFLLWWLHALVALGLVAAFPYTRLLHSLAGAVRLAAAPAPLGHMVLLSAEDAEQTGVVGVGDIRQFARRQLIELDACVSCGRCEEACPAFVAGKPLSPRELVQNIRGHLEILAPTLLVPGGIQSSAGGHKAPRLHGDAVSAETLWSCTTCSACVDVCPLGVNPLGFITDMRRHLIAESKLRGPAAVALQKTERSGNPWGLAGQDRMAWAAGLNVPTVETRPDFEVLYWVGCAAAYDRRVQKIAQSVVRLLTAADVKFAILGPKERCTGESARRMGDEFLFRQLATSNIETLQQHGVKRGANKIVSHCPHCVNSFKQDYPQLGGDYEIVHHSQYLAELAAEGRLQLNQSAMPSSNGKITYHDPCYLARVAGVTEAPRRLIQLSVRNETELLEMSRTGRQTSCCGAGGGRMWFDDAPEKRIGRGRVQEALATGAETVAVSCPFCLIMMRDGVAAQDPRVQVRDIAEILVERVQTPGNSPARH